MDQRFGKELRLRYGRQFATVIHEGSSAADGVLVVFAKPSSDASSPRLGITIPRRTGNAVVRNRWKRHIREAFRIHRGELPSGYDYVVRPKKGAAPDSHAIAASLVTLTRAAVRRGKK